MPVSPPPAVTPITGELPNRGQTETQFDTNQQNFVDYQAGFGPEVNDLADWMETTANLTEGWSNSADEDATTATTQAGIATNQAGIAVAAAASATLAPGTSATSTSTITPGYGSKSFTLAETGKTFVVNQFVTVASAADPSNVYFNGAITAFNSGTGAITVNAGAFKGSASASDWTITGSAPAFGQRFTNPRQDWVNLGTISGAVNLDLRVALSFRCTLSGNVTFTAIMPDDYGATDEIGWTIELTMDSVARTITYSGGMTYHEGANPITAPNTKDILGITRKGTATPILGRLRRAVA